LNFNKRVVKVSASNSFTLVLTDEGLVYGTGYNLVKWKLFYF
jgi:alpha-tubulin suppressor-like RCC1 family protein